MPVYRPPSAVEVTPRDAAAPYQPRLHRTDIPASDVQSQHDTSGLTSDDGAASDHTIRPLHRTSTSTSDSEGYHTTRSFSPASDSGAYRNTPDPFIEDEDDDGDDNLNSPLRAPWMTHMSDSFPTNVAEVNESASAPELHIPTDAPSVPHIPESTYFVPQPAYIPQRPPFIPFIPPCPPFIPFIPPRPTTPHMPNIPTPFPPSETHESTFLPDPVPNQETHSTFRDDEEEVVREDTEMSELDLSREMDFDDDPTCATPASNPLPDHEERVSDSQNMSSENLGQDFPGPDVNGVPPFPPYSSQFFPASHDDMISLRNTIQELTQEVSGIARGSADFLRQYNSRSGPARTKRHSRVNRSDDGSDDDTEDDSPAYVHRETNGVQHQRRSQNKLARDIKKHTKMLLAEREGSQLPRIPTPEELEDWNPARRRACTAEDFRPDLNSPPGTPWNKSVTEVFVKSFLDADKYECEDAATIRRAFISHLKSLRRAEALATSGQEAKEMAAMQHRRAERKRNLFHRRLNASKAHPGLRHHTQMLKYLGVDGMSSDDSDHGVATGVPQYRIVRKPWRHPSLAPWLRVFNALHRHSRFCPVRRTTRGAQAHIRLLGNRVDSSRAAVPQLCQNAYNPAWLDSLNEFDREDLQMDADLYDFSHSPEIYQLAQENCG